MTLDEMRAKLRAELPAASYLKLSIDTYAAQCSGDDETEFYLYCGENAGRTTELHIRGASLDEVIAKLKDALADPASKAIELAKRYRAEAERLESEAAAVAEKGVE